MVAHEESSTKRLTATLALKIRWTMYISFYAPELR